MIITKIGINNETLPKKIKRSPDESTNKLKVRYDLVWIATRRGLLWDKQWPFILVHYFQFNNYNNK